MATEFYDGGAFVRAATREAYAFVRLALLMPRDLTPVLPVRAAPGDDVVVFVHGALATAGAWRPLRTRLEEDLRTHTATFSYGPHFGVADVARALGDLITRLPAGVRVHLVGHSLGGLAVRWFVQETPSDTRVVQTVSVAAPFGGARGAWLLPGPAGRDMQRGSDVLRRLAAGSRACLVPHLSVFGTADTAVAVDTAFSGGERLVIPGAGHNALLFDAGVASRVVERVRSGRQGLL